MLRPPYLGWRGTVRSKIVDSFTSNTFTLENITSHIIIIRFYWQRKSDKKILHASLLILIMELSRVKVHFIIVKWKVDSAYLEGPFFSLKAPWFVFLPSSSIVKIVWCLIVCYTQTILTLFTADMFESSFNSKACLSAAIERVNN